MVNGEAAGQWRMSNDYIHMHPEHTCTYACKYTYVHSWLQSNTDQVTERIEVAVGMMKVMRERIDVCDKRSMGEE